MDDVLETAAAWRRSGEQLALATLIKVDGSAPRSEGAKMVIAQDGRVAGSVSGGCVEGAVAEQAMAVMKSGTPTVQRYGINREMMWDIGLSCGGAIEVFIEPLLSMPELDQESAAALCTVVRGPQLVGNKMVVTALGHTQGGLGEPGLNAAVSTRARELIENGSSATVSEGGYEVFVDVSIPKPQLILVGAVHIAIALCSMAADAGFSVTVIDPRPLLCNPERFPKATRLIVDWPDDVLATLTLDENAYVAVLTHDEKFDDPTLVRALPSQARYVGAIGSKKTQALRRSRLLDAGIAQDAVARLHGPIGLDIGSQSPEEIAVAILAEMIAVKHRRRGVPLRERVEPHIHS